MPRLLLCLEGWLISLKLRNCSPKTLRKNGDVMRQFLRFPLDRELDDIDQISTADIRRYLASRKEKVAPITLRGERTILHGFFAFCVKEELIQVNPVDRVESIIVPKKLVPLLSVDVIHRLLAKCDDKKFLGARNKAILFTLLDTGIRRGELLTMRRSDLYKEAIIIQGKGSKERYIRISPRTQKAIWRYLLFRQDDLDDLWLTEERRPLKAEGVRMMIQRLAEKAGISERVSAHIFRHTYATQMLRLGVDERSLQAFLGHSTSAMTKRYTEQFSSLDALELHNVSPVENMGL